MKKKKKTHSNAQSSDPKFVLVKMKITNTHNIYKNKTSYCLL